MLIKTASQQLPVKRTGGYRTWIELSALARWDGSAKINWQARGVVRAEVVRSSWRASCPFCNEAFVVEPGEPFFCTNCCMAGNNGYAMQVLWPKKRAEIERVLLARPIPETRNWLPLQGETLQTLIKENIERGDPVPEGL